MNEEYLKIIAHSSNGDVVASIKSRNTLCDEKLICFNLETMKIYYGFKSLKEIYYWLINNVRVYTLFDEIITDDQITYSFPLESRGFSFVEKEIPKWFKNSKEERKE